VIKLIPNFQRQSPDVIAAEVKSVMAITAKEAWGYYQICLIIRKKTD